MITNVVTLWVFKGRFFGFRNQSSTKLERTLNKLLQKWIRQPPFSSSASLLAPSFQQALVSFKLKFKKLKFYRSLKFQNIWNSRLWTFMQVWGHHGWPNVQGLVPWTPGCWGFLCPWRLMSVQSSLHWRTAGLLIWHPFLNNWKHFNHPINIHEIKICCLFDVLFCVVSIRIALLAVISFVDSWTLSSVNVDSCMQV